MNPTPSAGAAVRVVNLVKDFGTVRAVDRVSLDVQPGEFLALLGPSGSGKTTILMSIAGFERPTEGEIYVGERRIDNVPPHRRNVGMVFQRYALFPHLTVADNVAFPLQMRGVRKADRARQVSEALRLVQLDGYGERKPSQLSGGQQQRVALARALVYRPPVLLMDEPLGALDRKLREQLQIELRAVQRQVGATVIYVTHDQGEALSMADRIGVVHEGRIQQLGTPRDLYDGPANAFVANFIGETNLLEGAVAEVGPSTLVRLDGGHEVRVEIAAPGDLEAGERVRLAVRPERIRLRDGSGPGHIPGRITQATYMGDTVVYAIDLNGGASVRSRISLGDSTTERSVGDAVLVEFNEADGRLFQMRHR
jgi:spermidine/putrescine ABC transporter ATP-binding subunit